MLKRCFVIHSIFQLICSTDHCIYFPWKDLLWISADRADFHGVFKNHHIIFAGYRSFIILHCDKYCHQGDEKTNGWAYIKWSMFYSSVFRLCWNWNGFTIVTFDVYFTMLYIGLNRCHLSQIIPIQSKNFIVTQIIKWGTGSLQEVDNVFFCVPDVGNPCRSVHSPGPIAFLMLWQFYIIYMLLSFFISLSLKMWSLSTPPLAMKDWSVSWPVTVLKANSEAMIKPFSR